MKLVNVKKLTDKEKHEFRFAIFKQTPFCFCESISMKIGSLSKKFNCRFKPYRFLGFRKLYKAQS